MPNDADGSAALNDPGLPISGRQSEISEAIERHQVVIVAGDTGSGKSTQLPQYCLRRRSAGLIAHTQPRRLAARALAARIAGELGEAVGATVGFRVRFADRVSAATRLVLMTDGLLLAELSSDPLLRRYATIIVDEAHERTLNVDLLLGVLRGLLPRRPDLKLIVTSATLDVQRVALFFGGAPVIAVSGRAFPIEVRYAPAGADDDEDPDLPLAVRRAYADIAAMPGEIGTGDVLVFLPGEQEIRDVAEFLERDLLDVDVLPLYSRLSWDQQSRIFAPGRRRRVVLATNVAETSITVPGIRAVIDSGLARVSRYSPRNRLQRLPIEAVSQASAEQRKGRCGRLGPGLCIRLYTEEHYAARCAFTEPEVLRTNLAALLLRLAADELGNAEDFPFIDAPDSRALGDGYRLLQELEAFDSERRITRRGRAMARLPLDPRLARALLESPRFHAESEMFAVVAGLSVPDPRMTGQQGDGSARRLFEDGRSEFSSMVKLWRAYRNARGGPRRELRRWCTERGLSVLRLSEWDDVHAQVVDRAAALGIEAGAKPASYTGLHRALLAGFTTMVGARREEGEYLGTRGVRFHLFPGSPLKRRRPPWIMAAEIVETSRIFGRRLAQIEPNWIESAAHHIVKREFLEPDWDEGREEVVAKERVSFLGLTLSANRIVNYGPLAPEESRLIFAREALVYRRLQPRPDWVRRNDAAIDDAQRMEERLRTRDLVRLPEAFVEFYAKVLPRQVSSRAALEHFSRHPSADERAALSMHHDDIFLRTPDPALLEQFPVAAELGGGVDRRINVAIDYRFAPGESADGVTLRLPLLVLPELTDTAVDAAVPGLARPKVEALLRTLPKDARRSLIPIRGTADSFLKDMGAPSTNLRRLTQWLHTTRGLAEEMLRFAPATLPTHLTPRLAIIDRGTQLAVGSDVAELRRRCAQAARERLEACAAALHPAPWRRFDLEALPERSCLDVEDGAVSVYPTLAMGPRGVTFSYEWSAEEAVHVLRDAIAHLARRVLERQARDLAKKISANAALMLGASAYLPGDALIEILLQRLFVQVCVGEAPPPRTSADFDRVIEKARSELEPAADELMGLAAAWFAVARTVRRLTDDPRARPAAAAAAAETRAHLSRLLCAPGLAAQSDQALAQLPRYLQAEERRWQSLVARGRETSQILQQIEEWSAIARELEQQVSAERRWSAQVSEFSVWVEEYRISLYAQEMRTLGPVSAARLRARAAQIEAWLTR